MAYRRRNVGSKRKRRSTRSNSRRKSYTKRYSARPRRRLTSRRRTTGGNSRVLKIVLEQPGMSGVQHPGVGSILPPGKKLSTLTVKKVF